MSVRASAVEVLRKVVIDGRSLATAMPEESARLPATSRALLSELCYGVLRYYLPLAAISNHLISKPLAAKNADLGLLILLGLYQLIHMRLPDHAVVQETVAVADQLKKVWAKGLVNGVLREFLRRKDSLLDLLEQDIETRTAHPRWLIDRLAEAWPLDYLSVLEAGNQQAAMTLRVNCCRNERLEYGERLASHQIHSSNCSLSPWGVVLESARAVETLPGFSEGLVSVQDEASQLAAWLLELKPGLKVLDACAAPGGKTCHLLETEPALQSLLALDSSQKRLDLVADNLRRLGLDAQLERADANDTAVWWDGKPIDRILLDVPCSSSGVIRRHPDIKLLRRDEDIAKLAARQLRLLTNLWPLLDSGGILLYSTCSLFPEENWEVVSHFLRQTADAIDKPIAADWGRGVDVGRQLLPKPGGHDGFYYARLQKV
jgi:16S rRNA (cytosine967-C5)-methyltransferase